MRFKMWNSFLDKHKNKCSGSFELLFSNLMFVPGPGHIELNLFSGSYGNHFCLIL